MNEVKQHGPHFTHVYFFNDCEIVNNQICEMWDNNVFTQINGFTEIVLVGSAINNLNGRKMLNLIESSYK